VDQCRLTDVEVFSEVFIDHSEMRGRIGEIKKLFGDLDPESESKK